MNTFTCTYSILSSKFLFISYFYSYFDIKHVWGHYMYNMNDMNHTKSRAPGFYCSFLGIGWFQIQIQYPHPTMGWHEHFNHPPLLVSKMLYHPCGGTRYLLFLWYEFNTTLTLSVFPINISSSLTFKTITLKQPILLMLPHQNPFKN